MADEMCGSCHDGILVKILQEDGGTTKIFSCGHRLVSRSVSGANIGIKDSVVVEQRLGPQSAKPTSSSVSYNMSMIVVSMQQEMFQDAIHFFAKPRRIMIKQETPSSRGETCVRPSYSASLQLKRVSISLLTVT